MESTKTFLMIDLLKDLLKHHRKVTAFQKTVTMTIFLGVLICIFRNIWIIGIVFSYCACLYLSMLACRHIVRYHSYIPSEILLIMVEKIEHFFESFLNDPRMKLKTEHITPSNNTGTEVQRARDAESDADEFFYASEEIQKETRSQSIFYVDLEKELLDDDLIKGYTKGNKADIMNYINSNCPQTVQNEINKMIRLIQKDFIQSWYHLFSKHSESLEDADEALHEILYNILQRLLRIDVKKMAKILMCMFSSHVKKCKEARMTFKVQSKRRRKSSSKSESGSLSPKISPNIMKSLEECFGSKVEFHTALKSRDIEYLYLNSVVELLIIKLVPEHLNDSIAAVCALREILSCNVLSIVINLVCDPTFLHDRIIKITSDEEPGVSAENHSPVILESSLDTDEIIKSFPSNSNSEQVVKDQFSDSPGEKNNESDTEVQRTDNRRTSFLDDTKLHYVPKGMCNECNRLCSKDRDKIDPHPHTCSLGQVPCFLDVKTHDKESLSASSGEGSPVFKFYLSDMDNLSEHSCQMVDHSNTQDIPSETNPSPIQTCDKFSLQKVPKSGTKEPAQIIQCKSVSKEHERPVKTNLLTKDTLTAQNVPPKSLTQEKSHDCELSDSTKGSDKVHLSSKNVSSPHAASGTQESKFFLSSGNFFNFQFPQFGKKPLTEKNRSSSNLEQISDTETEDFSNLRRSKSSAEIGTDDIVAGQEALLYPTEAPLPFQEVHIEKTETAKEAGSLNPYTLYVVEYEAIHPTDEGIFVHRTGTVKRRFREFVNLQARLEDNPLFKKSMKDVKGPKKWLSLPFGNMDKDSIESRRKILTTFLTSLIKKEDICQGSELKEFLGYSGDGHIAFVRKVPENIGPRIDQRLVKTMSGMFDKIVEVLPSLPNELPRIIKTEKSREDSEMDKLLEDCDQIDLEARFDEDPTRCHRLHKALDNFIKFEALTLQHLDHDGDHNTTLGTSVLEWQEACSRSSSPVRSQSSDLHLNTQTGSNSQDPVPLCNALLDILSELLQGHDSWMCRETVMKTIKTVFGRALERYLNGRIDFLVSAEMNTFYLRTLRETVWPNDELSTESRPNYTDRQKEGIKKQAARCLGEFLPGVLHTLLGDEDFDFTIEEIMESMKCEKLNRHFWYSFLDVLVEHIFPEIKTEEIQRKLSRS